MEISRAMLWLWLAIALGGCTTATHEPANLATHKRELVAYVESGAYDRQIAAVAARAQAWVEERARSRASGEKLTIVFDLDETLLRNWPNIRANDFGYIPDLWRAWVDRAEAAAIEPVREVYRAARRAGVDVVFITGRRERDRLGTERNLRAIGCADYAALICKPDEDPGASAAFKAAARRQLTSEGRTIIANVGDQESDLSGGFAERTFKLPNPFYITE